MKKINSIGYAHRVLLAILLLLAGLPVLLTAAHWLWPLSSLVWARRFCFLAGGLLLAGFVALLFIEGLQDARINRRYQRAVCRQKHPTPGGGWECQACGSRSLSERDTTCPLCGIKFSS